MDKVTKLTASIEPNWGNIAESIVSEAYDRFVNCRAESDFSIQYAGYRVIVFGSHNRITWSADRGFQPEPSHCTPWFMDKWKEYYG